MRSIAALCIIGLAAHQALASEAACSSSDGTCASSDEAALVQKEMLMKIAQHVQAEAKTEDTSEAEAASEVEALSEADFEFEFEDSATEEGAPRLPESLIMHARRYFDQHPNATEAPVDGVSIPRSQVPESRTASGMGPESLPAMVKVKGKMTPSAGMGKEAKKIMKHSNMMKKMQFDYQQAMMMCAGNAISCSYNMKKFTDAWGPQMSTAMQESLQQGNKDLKKTFAEVDRITVCPKFGNNSCGIISVVWSGQNAETTRQRQAELTSVELFDKGYHVGDVQDLPVMMFKFPKNETQACCHMFTSMEVSEDAKENRFIILGNETQDNIIKNVFYPGASNNTKEQDMELAENQWKEFSERRNRLWSSDKDGEEDNTKEGEKSAGGRVTVGIAAVALWLAASFF